METLRRLRIEKGLSQARLAARAELDPSTVNQIERGAREASPSTLHKLAGALDVSLYELLEGEPRPKAPAPPPDPNAQRRREFFEHIKTLDRAALTALSEEIDEEYARVWTEWERAKESGSPELARLSTELVDAGTKGFMARLQMKIVGKHDADAERKLQELVGVA